MKISAIVMRTARGGLGAFREKRARFVAPSE
jgi:hypothetical protein